MMHRLTLGEKPSDLDRVDWMLLVIIWALTALTLLLIAGAILALCGAFDGPSNEQCVQQNYVHHAKVGYEWECTKWAKL